MAGPWLLFGQQQNGCSAVVFSTIAIAAIHCHNSSSRETRRGPAVAVGRERTTKNSRISQREKRRTAADECKKREGESVRLSSSNRNRKEKNIVRVSGWPLVDEGFCFAYESERTRDPREAKQKN
jgi:hypothetical protein